MVGIGLTLLHTQASKHLQSPLRIESVEESCMARCGALRLITETLFAAHVFGGGALPVAVLIVRRARYRC